MEMWKWVEMGGKCGYPTFSDRVVALGGPGWIMRARLHVLMRVNMGGIRVSVPVMWIWEDITGFGWISVARVVDVGG